jgi:hypothetical protein
MNQAIEKARARLECEQSGATGTMDEYLVPFEDIVLQDCLGTGSAGVVYRGLLACPPAEDTFEGCCSATSRSGLGQNCGMYSSRCIQVIYD